jgi:L-lysine exporter family protein LysE/ArgO
VIFLGVIGWLTWRSEPSANETAQAAARWPLDRQIVFAASVSLLNPHAILDSIGVIGTSALAYVGSARWVFAAACILNSWVWFVVLAGAGQLVSSSGQVRRWLNKASAVIMWGCAIYLVGLALRTS